MSQVDEEVYSTIFNALRHGVRRRILRMLSKKQMTFTALNEKLGISSSHLTYHLDSLRELVSKNDAMYKLSVFGNAAVDMISNVEDPPNPIMAVRGERSLKVLAAVLIASLLTVSGLYVNLTNKYNSLGLERDLLWGELEALSEKFEKSGLEALVELTLRSPHARLMPGYSVVSGYNLGYRMRWIDGFPRWEVEDYYVVFYAPMDNLTLRMYPFIYYPTEGLNLPLTIQKGIAPLNESGVPVKEEHYNITFWQSPIIWSVNVSSGRAYDALLPSKGWYTLCLTGPIRRHGDRIRIGLLGVRIENGTQEREGESAWVNLKLLRNEEPVLFIVDLAHEW